MELEFAPSHVTDNVAPANKSLKPPMNFRAHKQISKVDLGFFGTYDQKIISKNCFNVVFDMLISRKLSRMFPGCPCGSKHHVTVATSSKSHFARSITDIHVNASIFHKFKLQN